MLSSFAFWGLSAPLGIIVIIGFLLIFAFEIWMLIAAIQNKFITQNAKVLWVVGMFLLHPFVAIAYYFTDYQKKS
ncbi:MAG TPA: hypothetical protein VNG32_02260 [Candidatus Dormibacteraeota bacterium]|nr:hypothetical protein [Candidatus Dormibacteraeota bacterium]